MSNIEFSILFLVLMYILFVLARRLWPKRTDDEQASAPFVKRRQRAMIWTTAVVCLAGVASIVVWSTPQMFPDRLSTHQHWSIHSEYESISVRARSSAWIARFSQQQRLEPTAIEFESGGSNLLVSRDSELAPWVDDQGTPMDAADVIARFGVDPELTDLVDAVLTESWVERGLYDLAQPAWWLTGIYPGHPTLTLVHESSSRRYKRDLPIYAIKVLWVVAGLLIVLGLAFDRSRFKVRQPAATLPA